MRSTGAVRTLQTRYGLSTDQIQILITPSIRKPFTENSSSLIFLRRFHGQVDIRDGCHKDIKDNKNVFTDENDDP